MTKIIGSWKVLCYIHGTIGKDFFEINNAYELAKGHREMCYGRLFIVETSTTNNNKLGTAKPNLKPIGKVNASSEMEDYVQL